MSIAHVSWPRAGRDGGASGCGAELMVLAQTGKVTLHTRTYPLDDAVEALQDLDRGRVRGRAILVP